MSASIIVRDPCPRDGMSLMNNKNQQNKDTQPESESGNSSDLEADSNISRSEGEEESGAFQDLSTKKNASLFDMSSLSGPKTDTDENIEKSHMLITQLQEEITAAADKEAR